MRSLLFAVVLLSACGRTGFTPARDAGIAPTFYGVYSGDIIVTGTCDNGSKPGGSGAVAWAFSQDGDNLEMNIGSSCGIVEGIVYGSTAFLSAKACGTVTNGNTTDMNTITDGTATMSDAGVVSVLVHQTWAVVSPIANGSEACDATWTGDLVKF